MLTPQTALTQRALELLLYFINCNPETTTPKTFEKEIQDFVTVFCPEYMDNERFYTEEKSNE
jgi:hypothetical protein